jgi:hypothetical protein
MWLTALTLFISCGWKHVTPTHPSLIYQFGYMYPLNLYLIDFSERSSLVRVSPYKSGRHIDGRELLPVHPCWRGCSWWHWTKKSHRKCRAKRRPKHCHGGGLFRVREGWKYNTVSFIITTTTRSRDSSVGLATGYGLDDQGGGEFESR